MTLSDFDNERRERMAAQADNVHVQDAARAFALESIKTRYSYNFTWCGRPVIQYPQDMVALQEIVWNVRPDVIIETGIAHGGSLVLSASLLALLDYADAVASGGVIDPVRPKRTVIGVDIDIRANNRAALEAHPMSSRITMLQGSSTDPEIVQRVRALAQGHDSVLVCLDSNHTHEHVLAELEVYAPLVTAGSYCIVFDTIVDMLPTELFPDREWGPGNSPMSALQEYLKLVQREGRSDADGRRLAFETDLELDSKLLVSVAPRGYLKRLA